MVAFNFRELQFLPFQMSQQPGRAAPLLDARGDTQTLASVIQRANIARPTVRQAGELPPTGRELYPPFFGDGDGLQVSHPR